MLAVLQTNESQNNIIELFLEDEVTQQEFDETIKRIDAAIAEYGQIRILKQIRSVEMPPVPPTKFWSELQVGFQQFDNITHAAIVTDQLWIEKLTQFVNPLLKAEARCFRLSELDLAREWLTTAD